MTAYTTDKEIVDMLTQVSEKLAPSEVAFSKMLASLDTKTTPISSPYTALPVTRNFIFNSTYLRIASGFAVFVFVLGGMLSLRSKNSILPTNPVNEIANTVSTVDTSTSVKSPNTTTNIKPSILTSKINTETQSTLAVASLKTSTVAPEAVDLQTALTNELNAEISAQADLLALSDNI